MYTVNVFKIDVVDTIIRVAIVYVDIKDKNK